ncbi:hypothetical protein [Paenibacillus sp. P22]|uniref:hypothetical protein n=1 Tax=Paenibacillus sp. P22 TaxID=483908 RepID=UPI000660407D|nr:hypothetical protein [Paenibacillus sp. P22]
MSAAAQGASARSVNGRPLPADPPGGEAEGAGADDGAGTADGAGEAPGVGFGVQAGPGAGVAVGSVLGVGSALGEGSVGNVEFIPLIRERYDLVVVKKPENSPWIGKLMDILQSEAFRRELGAITGCDSSETGKVWLDS